MRNDPTIATRLLPLLVLLVLSGCFSLSRTETPQRLYVLGGSELLDRTPSADLAGLAIGIRRPRLASYLDQSLLVVRHGLSEIRHLESQRWAEPPSEAANRALAGYLAAGAAFRAVDVAPWPGRADYDYVIQLNVERFEGTVPDEPSAVEGEAHVLATWEILMQREGMVLARGTTDFRAAWTVGDYPGLVMLLDHGLQAVAADVRNSLSSLRTEASRLR